MDQSAGQSIVGRRSNNEDTYRIRTDLGLYLVADGMGGHEGGEIASRITADAVVTHFEDADQSTRPCGDDETVMQIHMENAIHAAHRAVEVAAEGELEEMGTTLAALLVDGDKALIAHVGDSRIYRQRGGRIERLTSDHSFMQELEDRDDVLRDALPEHFASMVTRCIALGANAQPDVQILPTRPGDIFMLCSDGLSDVLADEDLQTLLSKDGECEELAASLVRTAYDYDSQDNITCVVVRIDPKAAVDAA